MSKILTRLVLISHGATAATRAAAFAVDEPLEPGALAQAKAITVRRHNIAVCSPAAQCRETAAALGLSPRVEQALRDGDFGRWRGRTLDDVAAAEPDAVQAWLTDPDAAPYGGESLREILYRTREWLHTVSTPDEPGAATVLAVTHPAVIRALIVAALGADAPAFWRIDVPPLTQTILNGGASRWTLRSTGATPGTS